jgi:hypothetical protein
VLTDNGIQFTNRKRDQYAFQHIFDRVCQESGIDHRLTKTNHPWTNGQVERMNRTLKDATVKKYYDQTHQYLKEHLYTFLMAYNFAKRLKTLKGRWCTSIVRTIPTPEKQVAYLHFAYLGGGMRDGARPAFLRTPADGDLVALCAPDVGLATAPRRTRSHRSPASPSGLKALARPETLFGSHAQAVLCDL